MSQINSDYRTALNRFRTAFRTGNLAPAPTDPAAIDAANLALLRNRFRLDGLTDEQVRERFPAYFPNPPAAQPGAGATPGSSEPTAPVSSTPATPVSSSPATPGPATEQAAPAPVVSIRPRDNDGPRFRRFSLPPESVSNNYVPGTFIDGVA